MQTWHKLVFATKRYPQFVDDWNWKAVHAAKMRGLVQVVEECADGYCVDVLHITMKGKQWTRKNKAFRK